jgi:hypothetical protein
MTATEIDPTVVELAAPGVRRGAYTSARPRFGTPPVCSITSSASTPDRREVHLHAERPEAGWYWQRGVLDEWIEHPLNLVLKARQIGITWLAAGYALWKLLTKPGTSVLIVSINEDEAIKVVNRLFDMFNSLPEHLRFDATSRSRRAARAPRR